MSAEEERPQDGRGDVDAMIVVDELTRYYGELAAVRDVTFTARRGEIVGFLGPNGAGKSTTMRIITGYMPPTSGSVLVAGRDVVEDSLAARRTIGYLPENTPLYMDMTVEGYLHYMARLRDVEDRDAAVERVMALTGLEDRSHDLVAHLSKGFRQRVGLAQALVHDPPVMILDEPTIGLDPRQIREVRGLIDDLRGDRTILLSTHILPEAQEVCDRVLIISDGEIVAEDSPTMLNERLTGGERIRVAVAGDAQPAAVCDALTGVAGVQSAEHDAGTVYRVAAEAGAEPRPAIARCVLDRGWELEELTPLGMTLEEIFLELTGVEVKGDGAVAVGEDDSDPDGDGPTEPEPSAASAEPPAGPAEPPAEPAAPRADEPEVSDE